MYRLTEKGERRLTQFEQKMFEAKKKKGYPKSLQQLTKLLDKYHTKWELHDFFLEEEGALFAIRIPHGTLVADFMFKKAFELGLQMQLANDLIISDPREIKVE